MCLSYIDVFVQLTDAESTVERARQKDDKAAARNTHHGRP